MNPNRRDDVTRGSLADRLTGHQAEALVARYLPEGELITDLTLQHADLDLIEANGTTSSVKYQKAAYRTGNCSFEIEMGRAGTSERIPGNFAKCRADQYILVYPLSDTTVQAIFIDRPVLEKLVYEGSWPTRGLNERNIAINNQQGRYWNDAFSRLVPVTAVKAVAKKAITINLANPS